jgi:hypothetical protein
VEWSFEFGTDPLDVTIATSGAARAEDFRTMNEQLLADERFRPPMRMLVDHSNLDVSELTPEEVGRIADGVNRIGSLFGESKVALVAPTALGYGLARQFEALAAEPDVLLGIFSTRANALAWLRAADVRPPA